MHIRQLARNAALITVAVIVTAGFSTGLAQAMSAAPTSTISVASAPVTSGGTAPRVRMLDCPEYTFCAYEVEGGRSFVLAQSFTCAEDLHDANSATIHLFINRCTAHAVYYYYKSGGDGCVPASSQQGTGLKSGFPAIKYYYVAPWDNCP
jgi:hypothetical protein